MSTAIALQLQNEYQSLAMAPMMLTKLTPKTVIPVTMLSFIHDMLRARLPAAQNAPKINVHNSKRPAIFQSIDVYLLRKIFIIVGRNNEVFLMRIFIAAPAVKAGSSILAWLLSQHTAFGGQGIHENIEIGAMLNVLDHIPDWRSKGYTSVGDEAMIAHIRRFVDSVANPQGLHSYGLKFTNFYSFNWLDHVFPVDRKIVVVRNLFDWFASIKMWNNSRHGGWKPRSVENHLSAAANSLSGNPHIGIVHLEDLIIDCARTMRRVHEYLGLEPEPVDLTGNHEVFCSYTSVPGGQEQTDRNGLSTSPIGRRSNLTAEETDMIESFARKNPIYQVLYDPGRRLF